MGGGRIGRKRNYPRASVSRPFQFPSLLSGFRRPALLRPLAASAHLPPYIARYTERAACHARACCRCELRAHARHVRVTLVCVTRRSMCRRGAAIATIAAVRRWKNFPATRRFSEQRKLRHLSSRRRRLCGDAYLYCCFACLDRREKEREREIRKGGNTARVARITEIMLPRVSLDRGPFAIRELVRHFHGFND